MEAQTIQLLFHSHAEIQESRFPLLFCFVMLVAGFAAERTQHDTKAAIPQSVSIANTEGSEILDHVD